MFTTAHKSKGLEWTTVWLLGDFDRSLALKKDDLRHEGKKESVPLAHESFLTSISFSVPEDEKNLLYVAVTRAKKHLVVNRHVALLLHHAGFNFQGLVVTKDLPAGECNRCQKTFVPNAITMQEKRKTLAENVSGSAFHHFFFFRNL